MSSPVLALDRLKWLARHAQQAGSLGALLGLNTRMVTAQDFLRTGDAVAMTQKAWWRATFLERFRAVRDSRRADFVTRMFNAIHLDTLFKIDIVIRKDSPYRVAEFARRRQVSFGETMVSIVAPEDLLLSKLEWWNASGSGLQWADLTLLKATDLDWPYIERWAGEPGLRDSLARLRQ